MIDVIPSILVKTKDEFLTQINELKHVITHVQFDIADGIFVPNTTWSEPEIVRKINGYTFELHLMVHSPLETIAKWKDVDSVTRFIIHTESTTHLEDTIEHARAYGRELFVAFNPYTPLDILDTISAKIDGVLFMGVEPGFQGQKLIPEVLEKIIHCRKRHPHLYTELDGGVSEEVLESIAKSGVHAICPGSLVFGREHPAHEQIVFIKNQLEKLDRACRQAR